MEWVVLIQKSEVVLMLGLEETLLLKRPHYRPLFDLFVGQIAPESTSKKGQSNESCTYQEWSRGVWRIRHIGLVSCLLRSRIRHGTELVGF